MRELDKNRNRQIWYLEKMLERADGTDTNDAQTGEVVARKPSGGAGPALPVVVFDKNNGKAPQPDTLNQHSSSERRFFYGKPFSYVGFLTRIRNIEFSYKKRVSSVAAYRA
jgi:hypothetical protein